jgi:hypothetical protein
VEFSTIAERMLKIQTVFKAGQGLAYYKNEEQINHFLNQENHLYQSVAYEGVACGLAEDDIDEENKFKHWENFLAKHGTHHTQIHLGLGWALALKKQAVDFPIPISKSVMEARVFDGYGYVEGLFRKRVAILQKVIPEKITANQQMGYDQGLGRSMWYNAKGEVAILKETISSFPSARLADLWRGMGIAVGYVGGVKMEDLALLVTFAKENESDFKVGVLLSQFSRCSASNIEKDMYKVILELLKIEAADFEKIYQEQIELSHSIAYVAYLQHIKEKLAI